MFLLVEEGVHLVIQIFFKLCELVAVSLFLLNVEVFDFLFVNVLLHIQKTSSAVGVMLKVDFAVFELFVILKIENKLLHFVEVLQGETLQLCKATLYFFNGPRDFGVLVQDVPELMVVFDVEEMLLLDETEIMVQNY